MTSSATAAGTGRLGTRTVARLGYGAMQLAGPGVFGPPADRSRAVAVARRAVELGVDHVDTSDFYGPHVTNEILREALHPYDGLTLVTKVGARRDAEGAWLEALSADELRSGVHDNLRNLGVERLDVVNLRMHDTESSLAEPLGVLTDLRDEGLIDQVGISNVGAGQLAEATAATSLACVQNQYNLVQREDDALVDACEAAGDRKSVV